MIDRIVEIDPALADSAVLQLEQQRAWRIAFTEGERIGRMETPHRDISLESERRFGTVSLAQRRELEAIADQAHLDQIYRCSWEAENWTKLLTTPN